MENSNGNYLIGDLPAQCLHGRLGEIASKRLKHFPRAYSVPALYAAASAKIDERGDEVRTNLFVGLVGGVHSGKTQAIDFALRTMGIERPQLLNAFAGSGEALFRVCSKADGNPRIYAPDEFGHTLKKMQIEGAGFAHNLCSAFNYTKFGLLLGKKENIEFNCHLSILGGLVEERFSDLFDYQTTEGLYDRFMFGLCPGGFDFFYEPFSGSPEKITPVEVWIDPEVSHDWSPWFLKEHRDVNQRVVEIGIRCAVIDAACDGVRVVNTKRVEAQLEMIFYQTRLRKLLAPNPGETNEGKVYHRLHNCLEQHKDEWIKARDLFYWTHVSRIGITIAERVLKSMIFNGEVLTKVEETPAGKKVAKVKLAAPSGSAEGEEEG